MTDDVVMARGRGFIEAPFAPTTRPLSALIGAEPSFPLSASVRDDRVQAKYQSASDACVGFSIAQAFRLACLKKGIECPDLSGLFPYKLGRASMGLEDTDAGMSFEAMGTAVTRFGLCSEEVWPFNLMRINSRVSGTALHDGYDRRGLRGYYSIDRSDAVTVRHAISKGIPVIGAWQVNRDFEKDSGPTLIDTPTTDIVGSHAMVLEDYGADGTFGVLNHYDVNWRDNGRCRLTEGYVKSSLGFVAVDVGPFL
jgi:hypothetical protein